MAVPGAEVAPQGPVKEAHVRAGNLDRRITIEKNTPVQDSDSGELVAGWATLATMWAQVRPLRGSERFEAQRENAERVSVFRIRHRTDIDETMRIVYGGDEYDIESIAELGRSEGLEITATARVP